MSTYKVSVIIPVYGVRNFIGRCVSSLFNQTLKEVEFIFVNDATPDDSIDILKELIRKNPERAVTLLEHKKNKGLPAARNTGLAVAKGEFIFHCDSDDYVEPDMLQTLYEKAKESDAEIVWCDWFLTFSKNERYMKEPEYTNVTDTLCGLLSGVMRYNVWNKLVKRCLYVDNGISFPSGHAWGEDMTMIRLICCAGSVAYVPNAFYHYIRTNTNAYTKNVNLKALQDIRFNVNETLRFLDVHYPASFEIEKNYFKLNVKLPFLISDNEDLYRLWEEWYPEANKYIIKNKKLPFQTRLLQWMAWKKQFWFVELYYNILIKFRYGIIYK